MQFFFLSVLTDHESPSNRDYSDELVKTESFKADQMSSSANTTAISERSPHDDTAAGQQVTYNMQRYNTTSNILQPSSATAIQPGVSPNDYSSPSSVAAVASSLLPVGSGGVTNPGYGQAVTTGASSSHYGQHAGYYGGGAHAAAVASGNSSSMYLNPLQASFFYPHLYSSAAGINASGIHLHGNAGQHHSLNTASGEHHSSLDEFGVPNNGGQDAAIARGMEDAGYSHLDPGDESQTGPIRGAYGSGRSEHGVWRPY
jgi:hypothetical protein